MSGTFLCHEKSLRLSAYFHHAVSEFLNRFFQQFIGYFRGVGHDRDLFLVADLGGHIVQTVEGILQQISQFSQLIPSITKVFSPSLGAVSVFLSRMVPPLLPQQPPPLKCFLPWSRARTRTRIKTATITISVIASLPFLII